MLSTHNTWFNCEPQEVLTFFLNEKKAIFAFLFITSSFTFTFGSKANTDTVGPLFAFEKFHRLSYVNSGITAGTC